MWNKVLLFFLNIGVWGHLITAPISYVLSMGQVLHGLGQLPFGDKHYSTCFQTMSLSLPEVKAFVLSLHNCREQRPI